MATTSVLKKTSVPLSAPVPRPSSLASSAMLLAPEESKEEAKWLVVAPSRVLVTQRGSPGRFALPPARDLAKHLTRVERFISTGTSASTVSASSLAMAFGGICTVANSTVTGFVTSIRVISVRVWPAAGGFANVSWLKEASGKVPDELMDSTIPQGITVTNCLTFTPPARSLAQFWNDNSSTDNLFLISATVGSVVDVAVELTLPAALTGFSSSVTTGVLGAIYYLALDGSSTNVYPPVALPTTH